MKIALLGYGKMGKEIEQMALLKGYEIILCADAHTPINVQDLAKADVAIEFTQPHAAVKNIRVCFDANVPVVVGTTGWYDELKIISVFSSISKFFTKSIIRPTSTSSSCIKSPRGPAMVFPINGAAGSTGA